ncbi:HNH endonuclease [Mesorhizobium sp. M4B.F.Ca.ET.058.02.1.1]|uniref:HNH endonuclease n=1 Tax=Mesorhizobium sp. M4B.F.Ca.ET.058.02.1.1 TaxID=2493675 RepID=UPI000F74D10A|nr:HNH endonuclease [Mesorhizobium sp. M4B.F.Ca.ET.058.02.1.1]AZO48034.1 hypothetical protein EJ073_09540 [Mesorhizobium sp. M4B.F.Ca.ET.058.02.1.1]
MTMIEIFNGRYSVDEDGNVYSLRNNAGNRRAAPKLMKLRLSKEGYLTVTLTTDTGRLFCQVHRLVAQAFIPNPMNKPEVNHRDGIKIHNRKTNLEWATESENAQHAFQLGLRVGNPTWAGKINADCPNSKPVNQLGLDGQLIQTFPSMAEARRHGFSQGNISMVISGQRDHHKGFKWAFA